MVLIAVQSVQRLTVTIAAHLPVSIYLYGSTPKVHTVTCPQHWQCRQLRQHSHSAASATSQLTQPILLKVKYGQQNKLCLLGQATDPTSCQAAALSTL
jgi:hypothetical protein